MPPALINWRSPFGEVCRSQNVEHKNGVTNCRFKTVPVTQPGPIQPITVGWSRHFAIEFELQRYWQREVKSVFSGARHGLRGFTNSLQAAATLFRQAKKIGMALCRIGRLVHRIRLDAIAHPVQGYPEHLSQSC